MGGTRLDRSSTLVALGGGTTTDLAGFVAATYLRGIDWVAVPSTLVGQVDAAIGGKVGDRHAGGQEPRRRVPLAGGDGDRHGAARDAARSEELRNGLAEVVKTGLLAGEPFWELDRSEQVRRCAAFKAAVCLRDPYERGERAQLNLGHTFAHALEAASGYTRPARTRGRTRPPRGAAPVRPRRRDPAVEELLSPSPSRSTASAPGLRSQRDKKASGGRVALVLLERPGRPLVTSEIEPERVRAALDALIA